MKLRLWLHDRLFGACCPRERAVRERQLRWERVLADPQAREVVARWVERHPLMLS